MLFKATYLNISRPITYFAATSMVSKKHHSCDSQLLTTIEEFSRHLDVGAQIDTILLDFSKAFDKVPHQRLFLKLACYGIRGPILEWIKDFLTNRTQQIVLNNINSYSINVLSGVPQGSVLDPLLFLLYNNDLPFIASSHVKLYADDTLIYRIINSAEDITILQRDLNTLSEWANKWLMSFNPSKCVHLTITRMQDKSFKIKLFNFWFSHPAIQQR